MDKEKRFIVWFNSKRAEPSSVVGTKAANLMNLLLADLPVPDGFCITIDAWKELFLDNDREVTTGILPEISLPAELQREILAAYQTLLERFGKDSKVAVRSSALAEDLVNASFAGQYESYLNIQGEEMLIKAVQRCLASAWSVRISTYKRYNKLNQNETAMAVIIQVMISAEFAGVLFTIDPLHKNNDNMVVEITPGLGDSVVSGKTMPLCITINRFTGKIDTSNYFVEQGSDTYIDQVDWKPLLVLALKIEDLFHSPQDIEWAYHNRKFWILQTRPIIAQSKKTYRQIWTRANAGEILPGVIFPLTWSIFKPILQAAGENISRSPLTIQLDWKHPCGTWPDSPRLFQGRAYMELGCVYAGFGNLPGITPNILQRMLGFEYHLCRVDEFPKKHHRKFNINLYRTLRFWIEILGITKKLSNQAKQWFNQPNSNIQSLFVAPVDTSEITIYTERMIRESAQILGLHIQCTTMAFSAFGLLDRLIRKYIEPEGVESFESGLISDFQNISTVQQSIAIWDLAQAAKQKLSVMRVLYEIESPSQVIETWRQDLSNSDFIKCWDSFISRFGDRGTQEFELRLARWDSDPSFVLQTMREIIDYQLPNPRIKLSQQQETGHRNIQRMIDHVRSRNSIFDAYFLKQLIRSFENFVALRENLKYYLVGRFNALHKIFVALGKILEDRQLILAYEDIFFLRYEEILGLIKHSSELTFDAISLVAKRKIEHKEYSDSPTSDVWVIESGVEMPMTLPVWQDTKILRGIGCSPGQISGPACVLTSAQDNMRVAPGQILVAPSIDPGLTPLFLSAAGLVTEIGGMLSHGAIVAREYGLPAVVGVPHATKIIKNGQQIFVDGFTGCVNLGPKVEE